MKQFHQNLPGTTLPAANQGLPMLSASAPFETNYDLGIPSGPSHVGLPTFEGAGGGQHRRSSEFTPRGGGEGNEEQDLIGTLLMDEDDAAVLHGRQDEQMLVDGPQQKGLQRTLKNDMSKINPKGYQLTEEADIKSLLVLRKQRSSSEK